MVLTDIHSLRHLELTDEEKEKLDGSYKVAKKLEKLQKGGQTQQTNDGTPTGDEPGRVEGTNGGDDSPGAYGESSRSLDSQGSSEKTSPDTSLVGSNGKFSVKTSFFLRICIGGFIVDRRLSAFSVFESKYDGFNASGE